MKPLICFADAPTLTGAAGNSLNWTYDGDQEDYQNYLEVTMLGFLEGCFEPVDVRDYYAKTNKTLKNFTHLGFAASDLQQDTSLLIQKVQAIEEGRRVSKGK